MIASGALAGTAVGIMMIILTLRPGHSESIKSVRIKEFGFLFLTSFSLVAALTFSVSSLSSLLRTFQVADTIIMQVITATGSAKLITTGLSQSAKAEVRAAAGNLRYRLVKVNLAISVLSWIAFLFLAISSLLISRAARHVLNNGPQNGVEKSKIEKICEPYVTKIFGEGMEGTRLESEEDMDEFRG